MNENENSPEALKPASAQSNAKSPDNSEYIPDINKQNNMDLADGETENLENIENFIQEQAREINESKTIDKGSHNSELAGALQNDTFENDKVLEDLDSNDSSRNPVDLNEVSESGDKEIKDSGKCDDLSGLDDLLSKQNSDESVQNKIIESDSGDIGTSVRETIPSNNLKNDDSDFESETKESADDSSKNKEDHNEDKIAYNVKDDVNEEQTDDEIHIDTEEDSRKDAINTDAASSEDVTNEEQSIEKNEDESNVDEESEDVINDETEDVTNEEPEDVTNEEPEDVTNEEPEDVTNEEPEDVTNEEPEDVTNEEQSVEKNEDESNVDEESEDVINDETEDVTNEEPEDVTNEEPEDVTNEEPEDVTNEEPEDVTNEESEDVTNEEPEDDTNKEPEDDTNKDPEDVSIEELISANKNEDETNVNEEMETDTSYDKKIEKDDEQMEMDEPENMENDDSKDKSTDFSQESIKPNADIEDDKNQPDFENAPDHNPNDSQQDDNSEVSDPFDELLKSGNSKDTSSLQTTQESQDNSANDSNAEKDNDEPMENESTDADVGDTEAVAEGDEAEEDDDECLLPDTEQEVSEKDKVDAASPTIKTTRKKNRPLSVKPRSLLMKDEFQKKNCNAEDVGAGDDVAKTNETSEDIELDNVSDILESEDGGGDTGANDAPLENGVIRETYDLTLTVCVHCGNENPVLFRFLTNEAATALCSHKCLRDFRSKHPSDYRLERRKAQVEEIDPINSKCFQCETNKICKYKEKQYDTFLYYCSERCLKGKIDGDGGRIVTKKKKMDIRDISLREELCRVCGKKKMCRYETVTGNISEYVCDDGCLGTIRPPQTTKTTRAVRKKKPIDKTPHQQVLKTPLLKLKVMGNATDKYLEQGTKVMAKSTAQAASAREERERSFRRCCSQCHRSVDGSERNLSWETMDFCDESCLGKYQTETGANCANCKVAVSQVSLGKYCVRFGYDVRQFCCSRCLEEFKKGLKICCYCQRDITGDCEGFLAPVGDKGQFKDFCSQPCMERFDQMSKNPSPPAVWAQCAVCSHQKLTHLEVEVEGAAGQRLCSEPCFAAFKFVNNVFPDQCRWCKKYFERRAANAFTIYTDTATHCFCSKACFNVYISNSRHIVPCNWCKVKKYNFDMIKKSLTTGQQLTMCSLNCLTLYQVSINAVSSRRVKCDKCNRVTQAQYHLTMSDATVRNFCTYQCVMSFQGQYSKSLNSMEGQPPAAVPTGAPRRTTNHQRALPATNTNAATTTRSPSSMPVISNVESLASKPSRVSLRHQTPTPTPSPKISPASSPGSHATRAKSKASVTTSPAADSPPVVVAPPPPPPPPRAPTPPPPPPKIYAHVLVKPPPPVEVRNIATSAKPLQQHRAVSCRPQTANAECQTGEELEKRVLIPIPVPIYVPVPVGMYSLPFPIPVPIPLPIPTPVFVPTTRNSAEGIMKEIKKIHDKMPTDPFEAELLMMAEMVAGEKKKAESDSETDDDNDDGFSPADGGGLETSHGHNNNAFGEDMLQMALKMATEYDEPAVDLESAMQANTITPVVTGLDEHQHTHHHQQQLLAEQQRAAAAALAMRGTPAATGGRKRGGSPGGAATGGRRGGGKRRRDTPATPAPAMPEPPAPPQEKPDANMCLKYTFGVNAWKQWVMTKNTEMEKSTIRRKPFKSEILQLTADELNYSLCLFVKEVRKPNGSEYAPDTIYYLVLGIQQYLFENGRIDNIFTDPYYEKFTECLDEVARKFSVLYNDSQYIVTRVEEEHLWESKQLGAHSPHVLLSTLMFFNTKHFNLVTVEEHMQLSFSHIMKHWKRNPNSPGAAKMPGSRNVLLRFYPPQSALDANSRKKKVYEQQENEENPLRCPVKLYEFYLSKCPESVKTRNDVFYLLPERSCVPDSPVWYSTQALAKDALAKMLHRVKMVKEINIALLTS